NRLTLGCATKPHAEAPIAKQVQSRRSCGATPLACFVARDLVNLSLPLGAARAPSRGVPTAAQVQSNDAADAVSAAEISVAGNPTALAAKNAWERVRHPLLPRTLRSLGWRLLHGAVYTGGLLCHIGHIRAPSWQPACCPSPACHGQLETLEHLFLRCPDVAPVVQWLLDLWQRISGGRPPDDPAVVLADDPRSATAGGSAWRPTGDNAYDLWTHLRLAVLYQIWIHRSRQRSGTGGCSAVSIMRAAIDDIRAQMHRDWLRATADVITEAQLNEDEFNGRRPEIHLSAFVSRWALNNVLCTVDEAQKALTVHLTYAHPVAVLPAAATV
ncbi:MAG: hypothetical protein VKM97_07925, partial [Cyanobacteriota bacterium]|nr:hypothetical protein [Cyanobacteriota bacterium]